MQFIKNNFFNLLVAVLLVVILLQKCSQPIEPVVPTVIRDTTWVVKDSLIVSKPQVTKTIQVESHDTIINRYLPDTNYAKLIVQYQEVVNELLAKNIHSDSIRIDSNGYVLVTDTVQKNLLVGRSSQVNLRYPIIKETVTIPQKKVTQVYFGGGVVGSKVYPIEQLRFGLLFKNKKDQTLLGSVGVGVDGTTRYGLESYWKINLKK